ncbi:MAG: hypothetical protein JW809_02540 [Pirellulales bacterium]|nr:hypothetical protein [Pirellulales bacterium]
MMQLPRYSVGVGDRFAREGAAQLEAILKARRQGVEVAPVWNKSHREHAIVHSRPADVRREADEAVAQAGYDGPYFVDADHIRFETVGPFIAASDFFTLDVADLIGQPADPAAVEVFVERHRDLMGRLEIPGLAAPLSITEKDLRDVAGKFLAAVTEAGEIHRHVVRAKGNGDFVTEVSMDETDSPQTPAELLLILAAVADQKIPAQTIAPRFSGRFNKGVDYVGDVARFAAEFEADLAVAAFAVERFGLPRGLKLSVHSGSDKFSIYGPIRRAIRKFDAGLHLKTAGTTWLEELIGLASAGGDGLTIAKKIYRNAMSRFDELCGPYASVIDIDRAALPPADRVDGWDEEAFVAALRHDPACSGYNPNLRQLLHVGYKVAAGMGPRFKAALSRYHRVIAEHVTENLYQRHIRPLFLD